MVKKKVYIVTGDDEWLTDILIKKLAPIFQITLIKVKSTPFDLSKKLKLIILIGLIDFFKILFIQYKNKDYKIIKLKKEYLNNYLKKISTNKIFLVNCPFKINHNLKNIYNCHPSLLPNYKGLLPIPKSIFDFLINKKKNYFGITIHKINNNFDSGRIIWNKSINLDLKRNTNMKKIYEFFYKSFFHGLIKICFSHKINCIKIKKNKSLKRKITFYEILLLKLKLL